MSSVSRLDFRDVVVALLLNALQEARAGHCGVIDLEITQDAVCVTDDGRGLPVQPHPQSGRLLLEVIFTGARRSAKNTLALVNANCLWLEVEVHREGTLWFQRYELARPVSSPPEQRGQATRRGTAIRCAPVFGEAPTFEDLRALVQELSREEAGIRVKVRIRDRRVAKDETIVIA